MKHSLLAVVPWAAFCLVATVNKCFAVTKFLEVTLSGSDAQPNRARRLPLDRSRLAWLHVPKTGTTFANVLLTWACPSIDDNSSVGSLKAVDSRDMFVGTFLEKHADDCAKNGGVLAGLCGGHHHLGTEGCNSWEEHKGNFVGLFRKPQQRLLSGYYARILTASAYDVATYARLTEGCTVRMLAGIPCAEYTHGSAPLENQRPLNQSIVDIALSRLDTGFAFVGLTEQWELSVCLFHTMFGGKCHRREFENVRPGIKRSSLSASGNGEYNTTALGEWQDPYDGQVYLRAAKIFWANVFKYHVTLAVCRAEHCIIDSVDSV